MAASVVANLKLPPLGIPPPSRGGGCQARAAPPHRCRPRRVGGSSRPARSSVPRWGTPRRVLTGRTVGRSPDTVRSRRSRRPVRVRSSLLRGRLPRECDVARHSTRLSTRSTSLTRPRSESKPDSTAARWLSSSSAHFEFRHPRSDGVGAQVAPAVGQAVLGGDKFIGEVG